MSAPQRARCIHEPTAILVGADELSVWLPESKEYVQQVFSICVHCGRTILALYVFFDSKPFGYVRWRSDHELTRGLRRASAPP